MTALCTRTKECNSQSDLTPSFVCILRRGLVGPPLHDEQDSHIHHAVISTTTARYVPRPM